MAEFFVPMLSQNIDPEVFRGMSMLMAQSLSDLADKDYFWQELMEIFPMDVIINTYHFMLGRPQMKRWIDRRVLQGLKSKKIIVTADDFEASIDFTEDELKRGQLPLLDKKVISLAQAATESPQDLLISMIDDAFNGSTFTGYDDKALCVSDHPKGLRDEDTQSNDLSTTALSSTAFKAARLILQTITDDYGRNLRLGQDPLKLRLLVPPELVDTAEAFLLPTLVSTGGTNILVNKAKIVAVPGMSSSTAWFLQDLSVPVKAFALHMVQAPRTMWHRPEGENVTSSFFHEKRVLMGVDDKKEGFIGLWQSIVGSEGA